MCMFAGFLTFSANIQSPPRREAVCLVHVTPCFGDSGWHSPGSINPYPILTALLCLRWTEVRGKSQRKFQPWRASQAHSPWHSTLPAKFSDSEILWLLAWWFCFLIVVFPAWGKEARLAPGWARQKHPSQSSRHGPASPTRRECPGWHPTSPPLGCGHSGNPLH